MASGDLHLHLTPLSHGGDLLRLIREYELAAEDWLDLSSACNRQSWQPSASFQDHWHGLPDKTCLMNAAAEYYQTTPSAVGAGTQQIIEALPPLWRIQYGLGVVMVPEVGYQEHAFAWQKWGYTIQRYRHVEELLSQDWQVAVVIQPNNPTGEFVSPALCASLIEHLEKHPEKLMVWDEAFIDQTPAQSLLSAHASIPVNLALLRSVGKFFGLEGCRVGFLFGLPEQAAFIQSQMGPWPVATPAVQRVSAALQDNAWQTQARQTLDAQKNAFQQRVLPKFCSVFDSAHYQLTPFFCTWFLDEEAHAKHAHAQLHRAAIHTRLGQGWIRVAMPTSVELETLNQRLTGLISGRYGKELG